jgi:hypothetical protein
MEMNLRVTVALAGGKILPAVATSLFGQKIDADAAVNISRNNAQAVAGVVKFFGIIAAVYAGFMLLIKIFK